MASSERAARFRFLYRQGEGVIDGRTWALASLGPVGLALLLTLVAFVVAPGAPRDLAHEAFIDPLVVARHAYLIVYSFALILCAVAEYFVCAKRFADRGRPPALAGLAPMAIFVAAAAHWFTPRSEGIAPPALPYVLDALTLAILAWTIAELGFGASRTPCGGGRA
jgi:uncharacterized membrane protein YhaH (DUF805 family)